MTEPIYEYKGKKYRIFAETKSKVDGEWIDAIIYQTLYPNKDGWVWVRTKEEFFSLFSEVKHVEEEILIDGIYPLSYTTAKDTVNGIANKERRVGWELVRNRNKYSISDTDVDFEDFCKEKNVSLLRVFDDVDLEPAKAYINRMMQLGRTEEDSINYANGSYIIYNPSFKKQAEAAKAELLRRGGFWGKDTMESDIYMARLMGYGEEYILPYIQGVYPDRDVELYMKENCRKELLEKINL